MAKTTSQIIAENKLRNELIQAVVARSKAVDQAQSSGNAKAVAKTQSILSNAGLTDVAKTVKDKTKVIVPDEKKTSTDKLWDRGSKSTYSEDTAAKQKVNSAEKKLKEFEEKADIDWTDAAARELYENQRRKLQAEVDSAGSELSRKEDAQIQQQDTAEMGAMSDDDRQALEQYAVNQIRDQNLPVEMVGMMPTAQQEAAGLIDKIGQLRANELAETFMRQENAKLAEETEQKARQFADDHGVASSLLTVPVNAVSGVVGAVGQIQGAARSTGRYATLDPNATGTIGDTFTGAVRGQVAQNIEQNTPGILGKVGSVVYQGAMSLADTIARGWLGGGAVGGAMLAATGSFSQTMADAAKQGASPAQAAILATATAFIEAAAEKLPLDNLIKTAKGKGGAKAIWNILRQMGIEIAEEEATLVGTFLAEAAILQEKSDYNQNITAQILLGTTPEEAREAAALDVFWEAVNTAAVSAVSGVGGGIGAVYADRKNLLADNASENPQLAKPDKKSAAQTRAELIAQHVAQQGKTEAQQAQEAMDTTMEEAAQRVPQTASAPLTEEQQHMVNATAAVNGVESKAQKTVVPEEMTVNVKSAGTALTEQNKEKNTLAYTLASNLDSVRDMSPVSQLTGREFNDRTKKMPEQIRDFFKSLGNKVVRAGFGDVSLGEYGIGGIMNHRPLNRSKMVSLAAVPDVIKNGRQIAYEPNWKDRGYETFTFAAPVTVNGTEVYVAAVVNRKPDNKFYLSEMVDSQGNYVRIEESPSGNSKYGVTDGAENSGKAGMPMGPEGLSEGSNPSATAEPMPLPNNSISESAPEVNENPAQESDYHDEFEDWGTDPNLKNVNNPLSDRKYSEVGKRSVKAYMYENPAVKPFYQEQAAWLLSELGDSTKGERTYNDQLHYESGGEQGWSGTKRHTSESIAKLLDQDGMTYDQIERGLSAIVNDHGQENNAVSKRIEFIINDRLMNGYTDFYTGQKIPGNAEYLNLLRNQQSTQITDTQTIAYKRASGVQAQSTESGQQNGNYISEHLGKANAAIAKFRQSDEYKAMSRDQKVQAINEIMNYFTKVVDENEPGIAVASDGGERNLTDQNPDIKGTGAAERNFSGVAEYENMLYDGNIQRERPGAVRNVEMPKKDGDGRRVTEFAGNAVSAGVTPDRMADAIKSLVGDKELSFDTRTNQQSLDNAAAEIITKGEQTVISELAVNAANKTIVDGDIEKGLVLYAKYANDPDYQETASAIFTDLATLSNMSGRNLQLFSLLKRMTPEGQLMAVRKNVGKAIEKINEGRSGRKQIVYDPGTGKLEAAKGVAQKRNVQISEALEQAFLDAKTEDQKKSALDDIYKNVAAQIKPTLGEAWDAWRNLAMLGNLKTHERNFGSTGAFQPYAAVKRSIGAVIEKKLLDQDKRTKSVLGTSKEARDLLRWAKKDARSENVNNLLGGTSSSGDEARSAIQDYRKILPGVLDSARKKNLDLMEREDRFFKRGEYARSLAGFLKARGYAAEQLQNEAVPKGVLDEARQYAIKEAQKATFNDRNEFSDKITKLSKTLDDFGPAASVVRKGILPFVKTPANVVKRAMEYNPVSMANTLFHAKGDIHSGRKSAADVIDEVSAGLTGTAAMALGAALAAGMVPGVELIGAVDDEDELREGAQEYSIGIGGKYYSVAWLAPAMIPLFIGANLYHTFSSWDDDMDGWDLAKAIFFDTTVEAINPMLELSMLSSLNDFVDNISNEETAGDKVMAAFIGAASSYFIQGLPTLAGQLEQATETEKNVTYVNTDNELERAVKKTIADATKRIPGVDLYQTQKLDEWGHPVSHEGDFIKRTTDALLNPFVVTTRKNDPLTKEITRLNKAGFDVTPPYAARTVSYTDKDGNSHDDVRLTEEQYQGLAQTQGQTAKRIIDDIISDKNYSAMTDEQKAKAIELVYSYSKKTGEIQTFKEVHTGYDESWMMELEEGKEAGYIINRIINSGLNQAMSALDTAWDKGYDDTGRSNALQTAYDSYSALDKAAKETIREFATGTTAKYIEARDKGVSHEDFVAAAENIAKVKGTGSINKDTGKATVRDIDRRQAIANTTGMTEKEVDIVMKAYMADYDPSDESPETTELKYDYVRQELSMSAKEYAATYRAYLDGDKKAQKIAAIQALGYDWGTAYKLYKVYAGSMKNKLIEMYG